MTLIPMFVSSSAEYVFRDRPKLLISPAVRPVQSRITFSCALRSPCRAARIVESEMLTDLKENSFLIKLIFKFISCTKPSLSYGGGIVIKSVPFIGNCPAYLDNLKKTKIFTILVADCCDAAYYQCQ